MIEFKNVLLKNIADSQTGPFGSQLHESDYVDIGTPIVSVEHLGIEGFTGQNLPFVSDVDKSRLKKYVLQKGDIVFSRVGSIDRSTYVKEFEDGWMFSGRCIRVRVNTKNNSRYIAFYFRQENFKRMMLNISVGATMPSLNTKLMDNIPLRLPPLNIQNIIANVLTGFDEKILLNNKINQELEAMAKTLYDYWFVQFDFPDANGKPYKSSGGRMVFNKELKREIPECWEVKTLSEVSEIKAGGDKPKSLTKNKTKENNIPIYSNGISNEGLYGYTNNAKIEKESITISARGTIGYCVLRLKPFVPIIRLISVTPNNSNEVKYLFESIKNLVFENSGSVQQQLTVPQISKLKIISPPSYLINKYQSLARPGLDTIEINKNQNQELSELRDWLLPMLMNGQVTVGEAKQELGMVAEE